MRKPWIGPVPVVAVIVTGVLFVLAVDEAPQNAKVGKAQLGAKALADACESYSLNNNATLPQNLTDLLDPPFKGAALLKNGRQDLLDPWGTLYTYELRERPDGTPFPLVRTTTPEGVVVSQFGVGPKADPPR
jgi:hypothetical protein